MKTPVFLALMLSCVSFANCLYDPEEGFDSVPLKAKNDIVSIVNERAFMVDSKGKSTRLFEPLNRNFKDGKLTSASRNFWTEQAVKKDGKFEFKMIRMNQREVYIYKNGRIVRRDHYTNGKFDQFWSFYYEATRLSRIESKNINSGASSTTNCIYEGDKIIETNEFSKIIYQMNKERLVKYTTYSLEDKKTGKYKENQTVFYEYKNNMKVVSKVIDSHGSVAQSDDGGNHMFYDQEGASFPKKPVRAIYNKDSRGNWTSRTIYFEDGTVRKDSRTILYR